MGSPDFPKANKEVAELLVLQGSAEQNKAGAGGRRPPGVLELSEAQPWAARNPCSDCVTFTEGLS